MFARSKTAVNIMWFFLVFALLSWKATEGLAQSQHTTKLIEGAKQEGELMWYTSMGLSDAKPLIKEFEGLYPFIKVKLYRTGAIGVLNKILTEARAGKYIFDVAESSGQLVLSLTEKKLISPYLSPERAYYRKDLKDEKGYWTSTRVNPWMLGYNSNMLKNEDVPKSYQALLAPQWSGRKISLDTQAYALFQGLLKAWGKERALEYFRKLAAQEPHLQRGNNTRAGLVAAGAMPLTIALAHTLERYKSKQGAPIDWVPLEPVPVEVYVTILASKAQHPNAAKLFIDFVLSKKGQQMMRGFYRVPSRQDVDPNPPRLFRGYKMAIIRPDDQKALKENAKLYDKIFGVR